MTQNPTVGQIETPSGPFNSSASSAELSPMGEALRTPNRAFIGLGQSHNGQVEVTKNEGSASGPVVVGGSGGWTLPVSAALFPTVIVAGEPISFTARLAKADGTFVIQETTQTFTLDELTTGVNVTGDCDATDAVSVEVSGVTGGSWLQSFGAAGKISRVTNWDYFEDRARVSVVSDFGVAIAGVSRTSGETDAIGLVGASINDVAGSYKAWGAYVDAVKAIALSGSTFGMELNVANLPGISPHGGSNPNKSPTTGMTSGIRIGIGSDAEVFGESYAVDSAIEVISNGGLARAGLIFGQSSLLRDGVTDEPGAAGFFDGSALAIGMGYHHRVSWWSRDLDATGKRVEAFRLSSTISDPDTVKMSLIAQDEGFVFREDINPASLLFQIEFLANPSNYLKATPAVSGADPSISAVGADANIDLLLQSKGSGVLRFGTITTTSDTPITGYITIKDAGGTNRKLAVIA